MISTPDPMFDNSYLVSPFDHHHFQPVDISQSHHVDNPENQLRRRAMCDTCNRTFGRHSDLERHAKKHEPDQVVFHCHVNNCEYKGSYRKDKLQAHVKRCHSAGAGA